MKTIQMNMHEAKTSLSKLVGLALAGEDVVIAKAGKPLVKLTVIPQTKKPALGKLRGKAIIPEEAFAPMTEAELQDWE